MVVKKNYTSYLYAICLYFTIMANGFNESETTFLADLASKTDKHFLLKSHVPSILVLQSTTKQIDFFQ